MVAFDKGHIPHCSRNFPLFSAEKERHWSRWNGSLCSWRRHSGSCDLQRLAQETSSEGDFDLRGRERRGQSEKFEDERLRHRTERKLGSNKEETELRDSCRLMNKFRTLEKQEINLYDQHKRTRGESAIKKREREQRRTNNWNSAIKATFS